MSSRRRYRGTTQSACNNRSATRDGATACTISQDGCNNCQVKPPRLGGASGAFWYKPEGLQFAMTRRKNSKIIEQNVCLFAAPYVFSDHDVGSSRQQRCASLRRFNAKITADNVLGQSSPSLNALFAITSPLLCPVMHIHPGPGAARRDCQVFLRCAPCVSASLPLYAAALRLPQVWANPWIKRARVKGVPSAVRGWVLCRTVEILLGSFSA